MCSKLFWVFGSRCSGTHRHTYTRTVWSVYTKASTRRSIVLTRIKVGNWGKTKGKTGPFRHVNGMTHFAVDQYMGITFSLRWHKKRRKGFFCYRLISFGGEIHHGAWRRRDNDSERAAPVWSSILFFFHSALQLPAFVNATVSAPLAFVSFPPFLCRVLLHPSWHLFVRVGYILEEDQSEFYAPRTRGRGGDDSARVDVRTPCSGIGKSSV